MRVSSFAILLLFFTSLADAQTEKSQNTEVTLANTEVRELRSEIVDQEFRLLIARPFGPPQPPAKAYPVIYVLDADMGFPMVRQTALSLQSGGELPPVLIVGIAYSGGFREGMVNRNRDYTPTSDPVFMKYLGGGGPSGGADKFLRFIREELKPFVQGNYPADPTDATVIGISFGGLFAMYALLHHADTFQRYIAGSPSLWWGDEIAFQYEQRYANGHDDLPASVFVAAGGHETAEHDEALMAKMPEYMKKPMLEYKKAAGQAPQMVEVVEPFVDALAGRSYPSLNLTVHIFPGETHGSVPPMIISRGLRVVFGTL
jgi:predicted alpha/beta superfamily hydrolase